METHFDTHIPTTPMDVVGAVTTEFPVQQSRPICIYPQKATYVSGDVNVAASYACSGAD